jgi:hypothetical protein
MRLEYPDAARQSQPAGNRHPLPLAGNFPVDPAFIMEIAEMFDKVVALCLGLEYSQTSEYDWITMTVTARQIHTPPGNMPTATRLIRQVHRHGHNPPQKVK